MCLSGAPNARNFELALRLPIELEGAAPLVARCWQSWEQRRNLKASSSIELVYGGLVPPYSVTAMTRALEVNPQYLMKLLRCEISARYFFIKMPSNPFPQCKYSQRTAAFASGSRGSAFAVVGNLSIDICAIAFFLRSVPIGTNKFR